MSEPFEKFPLQSALDAAIVMHRDVHFGGNFNIMIKYYEKKGKGASCDFDLKDIYRLAEYEALSEQNIAPMVLTGADAEKVALAKEAYHQLRDLFDNDSKDAHYPRLIASLILSEEEEPQEEIEEIVKQKSAIVPSLLELLTSEKFYDPLFPGYGQSPLLAAKCLGRIGDKRAIPSLFEQIGSGDFFSEDTILKALQTIGEPAKEFLLKVVKGHPINYDNERAAIALEAFKEDAEVAAACFDLLEELQFDQNLPLTHYLIFSCEGLKDLQKQKKMIEWMNSPHLSKDIILDLHAIAKKWK